MIMGANTPLHRKIDNLLGKTVTVSLNSSKGYLVARGVLELFCNGYKLMNPNTDLMQARFSLHQIKSLTDARIYLKSN